MGSTAGMGTAVATSRLLAHRAKDIVPERMEAMEEAIKQRDFESFAKLTMQVRGPGQGEGSGLR